MRWSPPRLGPLGWLAEPLVLGAYMPKVIAQRNDYLKATAESSM